MWNVTRCLILSGLVGEIGEILPLFFTEGVR